MQAKLSLALRTAVIAPRFSPYTPTSAPKPLCRPSTMLKAIFFLGRQRMVILASQSHLQLRQLGASGVGCQMPWGTVEDLFRERQQQQGPDPAVPRVGSELTFVSPRGSLPPC